MKRPKVKIYKDRTSNIKDIFKAIKRERAYQDKKWGTIEEHPHDIPGWLLAVRGELQEAEQAWLKEGEEATLRELLQVVAVGIACLEQHGYYERDY